MVESSGLLNRRTGLNLYRGFESPPLRQTKLSKHIQALQGRPLGLCAFRAPRFISQVEPKIKWLLLFG